MSLVIPDIKVNSTGTIRIDIRQPIDFNQNPEDHPNADLSEFTSLEIELEHPLGNRDVIELDSSAISENVVTFEYKCETFTESGRWKIRAIFLSGTGDDKQRIVGTWRGLTVSD